MKRDFQHKGILSLDLALQPKQLEFYKRMEATGIDAATWLGYGGARGGGKSACMRRVMLARRFQYPATTGIIIRRVFGDVKANHIDKFFAEYPALRPYYRVGDHELILPNESRIVFGYAETAAEVDRKFWGPEYFDTFIDQAEQYSEEELTIIKTATRWPSAKPGQTKLGLFFNPGGIGTDFLRRVFYLKQYKGDEKQSDYDFLQAYGWDNYEWFRNQVDYTPRAFYSLPNEQRFEIFIHQTSEGRKLNALPPSLRAGHLLGSFEHFAGQYFAGVWDESKCILTVQEVEDLIQPWWTRWTSTDWGFAHYSCHFWWTAGRLSPAQWQRTFGSIADKPIEIVILYREYLINETGEEDLALKYVEMTPKAERALIKREYIGPDVFAKRGSANTVAEQFDAAFERNGLPTCEKADDDRVGGYRLLYDMLRRSNAARSHSTVPEDVAVGGPMLFISANCPETISAIPMIIRDKKNPEDAMKVPGAIYDEISDNLRYGTKSHLDAKAKAPMEVRLRETLEPIEDMTAKHMAHLRFKQNERPKVRRGWR